MKSKRSNNVIVNPASATAAARTFASKAFAVLMSAVLVLGLCPITQQSYADTGSDTPVPGTKYGNITYTQNTQSNGFLQSTYDKYRDGNNVLGIANSFHIVAFDTLNAPVDVYGNILVKNLASAVDTGTSDKFVNIYGYNTLSYIQNYTGTFSRWDKSENGCVVFGSGVNLTTRNNSELLLNGSRIEKPNLVVQDADTSAAPFINLNTLKSNLSALQSSLASQEAVGATQKLVNDGKVRNITINEGYKGCAYVSLTAAELQSSYEGINIDNLPIKSDSALVINVDCQGASSIDIPKTYLRINGQNVGIGEVDSVYGDTGYVLYNFYNTASNLPITVHECTASVLAPSASLTLGPGSACGTFIGNNVTVAAESHFRPFHGNLKPSDDTTSVNVSKVWKDSKGNVESGEGHQAITAELWYADEDGNATEPVTDEQGNAVVAELSQANSWSASWSKLPTTGADGQALHYTVKESATPSGYESEVTGSGNSFTITNTHVAETSISVQKEWSDSDDADGIRPDSITVKVLRSVQGQDPVEVEGAVLTLSASEDPANNWKASLDHLDKFDAEGNEYTYSLSELQVEGYEVQQPQTVPSVDERGNVTYSFVLTNVHEASKVNVGVTKVWKGDEGKEQLRPASVVAQLYTVDDQGNLTPVEGKSVELNEGNNWTYSWDGLLAKCKGETIKYTVRETQVPDGYEVSYEGKDNGDGTYSFTMTNTCQKEEEEFSLSGYSMRAADAPAPEADKICYVDPKVVKVLEGRTLKAGEFSFQLIDDATGGVVSTATNDEAGMVDFDKAADVSGNPDNPSCLKFSAPGTYTYTVRETPNQVKDSTVEYSTEVVQFVTTVGQKSDGSLYEVESHYVKYPTAADAQAKTQGTVYESTDHPSITNKAKPLSLGLVKSDGDTGVGLEGAVYGLYRVDDSVSTGAVQVMTASSNADGAMVFTGADASAIKVGDEYFFQEISAPDGYTVSENKSSVFQIEQASDGMYYLVYDDDAAAVEDGIALASNTEPTHYAGTPTDPIVYKAGSGVSDSKVAITFGKVSSDGTALSGAELAVRDESGADVSAWTTDGVGHVVNDLAIGKKYVLYEKAAPEGYQKADEVAFTVDEYGKVAIASGAEHDSIINAYAVGSTLNLVDYKSTELVEKNEVVREVGVPAEKGASTTAKSTLPKTADGLPLVPLTVAAGVACVAVCVSVRKRRRG